MAKQREVNVESVQQCIFSMMQAVASLPDGDTKDTLASELSFMVMVLQRFQSQGAPKKKAQPWRNEIDRVPLLAESPFSQVPTFIVGAQRSGTTLLSWLLDAHPSMSVPPETHLGRLLSTKTENGALMINMAYGGVAPIGEDQPTFIARFAKLVDDVLAAAAARRGKKRWVNKEVWIHESMDLIDRCFDYRTQWVYIVRHGLDCALSAAEYRATPMVDDQSLTIRARLKSWVEHTEATTDFAERNPDRVHVFRFEDFIADPLPHARAVFEFLDEPWRDDIFERMQNEEHPPFIMNRGDNKIHLTGGKIDSKRTGRWRELPAPLIRQLGKIANPTLARHGYDRIDT